jgi:two-component system, OmpR family, heavy metal sensor histidine kinase CusS
MAVQEDAGGLRGARPFPGMSLRNRIALYYTGTTAMLMAVVFTLIFLTVDRVVYSHFDEELRHEVNETLSEAHVHERDVCEFDRLKAMGLETARGQRQTRSPRMKKVVDIDPGFVQLVDSNGQVVSKTENLARNVLTFKPSYSGVRFFTAELGESTLRQVQVPLLNENGVLQGYLIVAVPLKSAMIVLRDLKYIVLIAYPVIIFILFILTRVIAGKSIQPVEEVITTAESITQTNLDLRMPLPARQDELYRMSATINALLDRLQDAFQREKQFTADASHELKTPLAVVKGTLEVLVRKPREIDYYESRIRYCLEELNRMARLIDQLLLLARCESDSVTPRFARVDMDKAIEVVRGRVEPVAAARSILIDTLSGFAGKVSVDPAMLEMMLENLLTNAIKYSPENSAVSIRTGEEKGVPFCLIEDHGIGISREKLQHIFKRFYRVDESRSTSTGGAGLGLSIVKRLAELQDIGIEVESREKSGTTVRLTFPPANN